MKKKKKVNLYLKKKKVKKKDRRGLAMYNLQQKCQ